MLINNNQNILCLQLYILFSLSFSPFLRKNYGRMFEPLKEDLRLTSDYNSGISSSYLAPSEDQVLTVDQA